MAMVNHRCRSLILVAVCLSGCSKSDQEPTPIKIATEPAPASEPTVVKSEPVRVTAVEVKPVEKTTPPNRLSTEVTDKAVITAAATSDAPKLPGAHQAVYAVDPATMAEMVRRNGPIFVDWPKPQVALLITGEQWGYFEPCGCAGLENQKGGMSRRYSFLKQLREQGWPVVPLDVGGMVKRYGRQQEIKFQVSIDALRAMNYQAIAWGPHELRLSTGELVAAITEPDGSPSRVVSANVGLFGADSGITPGFKIIEQAGRKIGVTSVLADSLQAQVNNPDLTFTPAEKGIEAVLPELKKADLLVLLCHGSPDEARKLGERFTEFQFVIAARGADEPAFEPAKLPGENRWLIDVGHKAMYGVVIGLFDDPKTPVRYQRVPFDARFADSPDMHKLKTAYQQQLQQLGWTGLGITPKPNPRAADEKDLQGQYVGSAKCGECHTKAFEVWKDTPHAGATDTLVHLDPPRHFDAECVSCHVTGWSPQEYFPYTTGFLSLEKSPLLTSVGCENCHGPGAAHVAAEMGGAQPANGGNPLRPGGASGNRDKLREAMRVALGDKANNVCSKCHDIDNSPAFELMGYWEQIVHKGKN